MTTGSDQLLDQPKSIQNGRLAPNLMVGYPSPLCLTLPPSNRSREAHPGNPAPTRGHTGRWTLARPPHLRGSVTELLLECPETGLFASRTGVWVLPTIVGYLTGLRSNLGPSNRSSSIHSGRPLDRYENWPAAFSVTFPGLGFWPRSPLVVARGHTRRTPYPLGVPLGENGRSPTRGHYNALGQ